MIKANAFTGGLVDSLETINNLTVGGAFSGVTGDFSGVVVTGGGVSNYANAGVVVNPISGQSVISIQSLTTGYGYIFFGDGVGGDAAVGLISYNHNNDHMSFFTATALGLQITNTGDVAVTGALSKGSGSFKIDHPLKPDTHHLVHSFIEGPQADLYYRGRVTLVNGKATVNIDAVSEMTEGTFEALCGDVQCLTSNETAFNQVRGSVVGNILTIECEAASADTVSWLVIGERKDQHMLDTEWTDENGHVIVEPIKQIEEVS
jgi:hypothetical protein